MSAYIVDNKTISAITQYAHNKQVTTFYNGELKDANDVNRFGQILLNENYRSVNHRYNEKGFDKYQYETPDKEFSQVEIIKICHCLRYQSCETDDYDNSLAAAFIESVLSHITHNLPGYDKAPWGLD